MATVATILSMANKIGLLVSINKYTPIEKVEKTNTIMAHLQ